jgi:hypothetical protein
MPFSSEVLCSIEMVDTSTSIQSPYRITYKDKEKKTISGNNYNPAPHKEECRWQKQMYFVHVCNAP